MVSKSITISGKQYESYTQVAKEYNLTLSGVSKRMARGWTDKDFEQGYRKGKNNRCRSVTILGVTYKSIRDAAESLGVCYSTLVTRLSNGWTDEDFKRGHTDKFGGRKSITILGKQYSSITDAAKALGIKRVTLQARLRYGWTDEDFSK